MSAVSVESGVAEVPDGVGGAQPVGAFFERMPFGRAHVMIALALFMAFVVESWSSSRWSTSPPTSATPSRSTRGGSGGSSRPWPWA
ncbi:hypothetical protein ACFQ0M_43530 [Kitasatospora aburaviensis]